ncbi:hypothetical protein D3C86_1563230 [compost metagenome]
MAGDAPHRRRQQGQPGQQAGARAEPARGGEHRDAQAEEAGERHAQPCLPVAHAEGLVGQRGDPQVERGLLEVLQRVVADGHPVAAGEHLAGDLRVAAFIRLQQVTGVERAEPDQQDCDDDQDNHADG